MQPDSPAPDLRAKHLTMHLSESWDSEDRRSMLKLKLKLKLKLELALTKLKLNLPVKAQARAEAG